MRLHLTAYPDSVEHANIDLDCLSSMQNLQHLHINNNETNSVWHSRGLLSSLTALKSFTFLGGESNLQGPLVSALSMLPKLTQLRMPWVRSPGIVSMPGGSIELCSMTFSALEGLHITSNADEDVPQEVFLSTVQPFDTLCDLSLICCHVSSAPIPFATLPHLIRVELERCGFAFHGWVSDAFEGATQVEELTLDNSIYGALPSSICQMRGVRQLSLQCCGLLDLPAEFAHLTNLEHLDLYENFFKSVPEILKQMTHLQTLDMMCCH